MRKLKRGTTKYKGNVPLKCFEYGILLPNVLLKRGQLVRKNKVIGKKRNIGKEKKERTRENYSRRKVYIQEKVVAHLMMVKMILIEFSSWN